MIPRATRPWPWLSVCVLLLPALSARETERLMLSGHGPEDAVPWEFSVTGGRRAGEWTTIPVPSCWEQEGFGTYNYGRSADGRTPVDFANEQGLYRLRFDVPQEWSDRRVRIVFDGVMTDAEVSINGRAAGPVHQGAFYRFHHDITGLVKFGESNLLEVTVSKMSANESVNRAERHADYWVFGGIFRPVWLEGRPAQSIEWTGIDAKADGSFSADVHVTLPASKGTEVSVQIFGPGHSTAEFPGVRFTEGSSTATVRGVMKGIMPWTAETPHLYAARFTLTQDGSKGDAVNESFGFRTFEVRENDGLYLNGVKIRLKGVNRHAFRPESGRTLGRRESFEDVKLIKEMNMNAVRMSHYPPEMSFLSACDTLGLYVLDELAGWQDAYDTPTATRLVGEMIRRDVNHPSVLFWDNGNEGGWNTEVDGEFAKWDIQRRPVLHPWAKFSGIDTDHYEAWDSHLKLSKGPMIYLPTEILHGLYDGGHGAALHDYWNAVLASPTAAGMFLWVFADEGIVRTDQGGRIDNAGNLAPDGIAGPHHEPEGSFFTIMELWSPIQIGAPDVLPADWNGVLSISNNYDFTSLDSRWLRWRLLKDRGPDSTEMEELHVGEFRLPAIAPHDSGKIHLALPFDWAAADLLHVTPLGSNGEELWTWSIPVARAVEPHVSGEPSSVAPQWLQPELIAYRREDRKFVPVEVLANALRFQWRSLGDGAWRLDYTYTLDGEFDIAGVQLLSPGTVFESKRWLGRGPYRVWQNRMEGGVTDVHEVAWNDSTPGETFEYPEFTGFFRDWRWLAVETEHERFTVQNASGVPFFGLGCVRDGVNGLLEFPDVGLAFLDVIPAMRNKFHSTEQLGPQSQVRTLSGTQSGTLIFRLNQ